MEQSTAQKDVLIATFDCLYCSKGYNADVLARKIECPGCGARPTYEQIRSAIPVRKFKQLIEGNWSNETRPSGTSLIEGPTERYGDNGSLAGPHVHLPPRYKLSISDVGPLAKI